MFLLRTVLKNIILINIGFTRGVQYCNIIHTHLP